MWRVLQASACQSMCASLCLSIFDYHSRSDILWLPAFACHPLIVRPWFWVSLPLCEFWVWQVLQASACQSMCVSLCLSVFDCHSPSDILWLPAFACHPDCPSLVLGFLASFLFFLVCVLGGRSRKPRPAGLCVPVSVCQFLIVTHGVTFSGCQPLPATL